MIEKIVEESDREFKMDLMDDHMRWIRAKGDRIVYAWEMKEKFKEKYGLSEKKYIEVRFKMFKEILRRNYGV